MTDDLREKLISAAKCVDSGCGEPTVYNTPVVVRIRGQNALFARPEMRVDKISYPVPTFSVLRNILQSVYWHPGMNFVPAQCVVVKPIRYDSVTSKGVKSIKKPRDCEDHICAGLKSEVALRTTNYLWDVEYIVTAYIVSRPACMNPSDSLEKFYGMLMKRLERGKSARVPFLGARECLAEITPVADGEMEAALAAAAKNGSEDFGIMTMDYDYTDHNRNKKNPVKPVYIHLDMKDGVVDYTKGEVYR